MTNEFQWACVNRLRAAVERGDVNYHQAWSDTRIALRMLEHFRADAEFLREEKARVWGKVNEADRKTLVVGSLPVLGVFSAAIGIAISAAIVGLAFRLFLGGQ